MSAWLAEHWEDIRLVLEIAGAIVAIIGGKYALVYRAVSTVLVKRIEEAAADSPEAKRALRKKRIGQGLKRAGNAVLEGLAAKADSAPDKKMTKKRVGLNILKALFRR